MFYPEKRDGFARSGKFEVDGRTVQTPAMLEVEEIPDWDFGLAPASLKFLNEELFQN